MTDIQLSAHKGEHVMGHREVLASWLGADKLAELNRQPAHWPMKEGPEPVPQYIYVPLNAESRSYSIELNDELVHETPWELEGN